ncbi:hypothetical protein AB4Z48_35875 [Cupriavidus sp. 2TAF22]|uniref:hypothetical protein n=1 Tax=unclassified Cupriavidus TaxID=2640874 RepID=UPI003F90683D
MTITTTRLLLAAAIAGTALLSLNSAFAADARSLHAGDDYGYVHRTADSYGDGARKADAFSDGARTVVHEYPFGFAA